MRILRRAAVGLLFASLPLVSAGCANLSPRWNALPALARHRADTQYQAAREAEQRGHYAKARDLYAELQRQSPNTPLYAHRMGVVCIQLKDFETAGKYFEHARSLDPRNPALLADMGYSAYLQKEYSSAEALLREAADLNSNDARAMNNLALAIGHQGRYDESLAIFRRSNSETQALLNIAFVQSQRNDFTTAQATYQQVLSTEPGNRIATRALQILVAELEKSSAPAVAAAAVTPPASTASAEAQSPVPNDTDIPEVSIHPAEEFAPVRQAAPIAVAAPAPIAPDDPVALPLPALVASAAEISTPAPLPVLETVTSTPPGPARWTPTQAPSTPSPSSDIVFELPERPNASDASEPAVPRAEDQPIVALVAPEPELAAPANPVADNAAPIQDDLAGTFAEDDAAPEPMLPETEELAGLDWAQQTLADDRRAIEAGTKASPQNGDCLRGYCPVVLRDERRLEPAIGEFHAEFQGQTFRFSSAGARERFLQHPQWYAPVEQGQDILQARVGTDQVLGSLDHACWFRHRLHLFSNAENLAAFRAAPRAYTAP